MPGYGNDLETGWESLVGAEAHFREFGRREEATSPSYWLAQIGRPSQRGEGDVHGTTAAGATPRLLKLPSHVLVHAGEERSLVPAAAVRLCRQRLGECRVHTPTPTVRWRRQS